MNRRVVHKLALGPFWWSAIKKGRKGKRGKRKGKGGDKEKGKGRKEGERFRIAMVGAICLARAMAMVVLGASFGPLEGLLYQTLYFYII